MPMLTQERTAGNRAASSGLFHNRLCQADIGLAMKQQGQIMKHSQLPIADR